MGQWGPTQFPPHTGQEKPCFGSAHLQVVHELLLNQELQLLPGQGVLVPLPSRVLVEDIDDDIYGLLQLRERSLGLAALEEKQIAE